MDFVIPLMGEAWDHRRRRRRKACLAVAIAIVTGLAALAVLGSSGPAGPSGSPKSTPKPATGLRVPAGAIAMPASAVFSEAPYMGVNCPGTPNSIACDRVGLAIWLKRPAYSVQASIAGAGLPLDWLGDERRITRIDRRRAFTGYLQPAGIVSRLHVAPLSGRYWYGENAPEPIVRLLIDYGRGRYVVTHLRVGLNAGWG